MIAADNIDLRIAADLRATAVKRLRDEFAMAALASVGLGLSGMTFENIAGLAYNIADAMMEARK